MKTFGGIFITYFLLLIAFSILMLVGLHRGTRGLMLPWMSSFGLGIAFQCIFGLWLIGGYYIYVSILYFGVFRSFGICSFAHAPPPNLSFDLQLDCVMYAFILWLWMGYNVSIPLKNLFCLNRFH